MHKKLNSLSWMGRVPCSVLSFRGLMTMILMMMSMIGLTACKHEKPNLIYMPDMVYSPALKAQQPGSMRMPVEGTVPRGFERYQFHNDPQGAGRELRNPLKPTQAVLNRGKYVFNNYCNVCHGALGHGDGPIIPKFPRPLSLLSEKARGLSDGDLFNTVTKGQNLMPSYAAQISVADRWAVIHFVRVLQKAGNPTPEDLKIADQESN